MINEFEMYVLKILYHILRSHQCLEGLVGWEGVSLG
jgi:hypothetical protein